VVLTSLQHGPEHLTQLKPQTSISKPPVSYSAVFNDHLTNPRNAGELADANALAEETNPVCGDRLRLSLIIRDGQVVAARFLAYGCPPTIACGSVLTEAVQGKRIDEVVRFTRKDLLDRIGGLPSRKQHAAALAIETLRKALEGGCSELIHD
jgi:NifU-like protein involved in Fe-S cluster formation